MNTRPSLVALLTVLGSAFSVQAHAQALGQHPAVLVQQAQRGIDPNTFIPAHPAHGNPVGGHAGHQHPAVTAWRAAAQPKIDANRFLVQPPATTSWTQPSAAGTETAAATAVVGMSTTR